MPSRSGSLVKAKFEALLRRDLTDGEALLCEELAANYHTGPILSYLEREAKKPIQALFETVYAALRSGVLRHANRRAVWVDLTGRLALTFKKLDLYRPGMSDGEVEAVLELVERFNDQAIDRAIIASRARGVKHVRYVLQVAVNNMSKPTPKIKTAIKAAAPDVVSPKPADVEKAWARSLKDGEELRAIRELEKAVRRNG